MAFHYSLVEPLTAVSVEGDTWLNPSTGCRYQRKDGTWVAENVPCATTPGFITVRGGGRIGNGQTGGAAVQISAGALSGGQNRWNGGPFDSQSGAAIYVLVRDPADNRAQMWRSPDGGQTWATVDNANRPAILCEDSLWGYRQPNTNLIHVVTSRPPQASDPFYRYHRFNMTTDTWDIRDEVFTAAQAPNFLVLSGVVCAARSNGDVIALYFAMVGGIYQIHYARRVGGVWTADILVHNSGAAGTLRCLTIVVGASDRMHFFYSNGIIQILHRSLSSANVLDAEQVAAANADDGVYAANTGIAYVDAAGNTQCVLPYARTAVAGIGVIEWISGAAPVLTTEAVTATQPRTDSDARHSLVYGAVNNMDAWVMFVSVVDNDVYSQTQRNNDGWRTDTARSAAITAVKLTASFVGNPPRLAWVYRGAGSLLNYQELADSGAPVTLDERRVRTTDDIAPTAPGANLVDWYSRAGQPRYRAGAAGAETTFFDNRNNAVPASDLLTNLGAPATRFANIYGQNIVQGDSIFQNGWRITEAEKLGLPPGLALVRPDGTVAHVFH